MRFDWVSVNRVAKSRPLYPMVRMFSWFRANAHTDIATQRYVDIVTAARNPVLFEKLKIPDTLDGRFEAILLHGWLVMRRLKQIETAKPISQRLFDILFQDMDQNLREMGASDVVVGDRVKAMAKAFYGRIAAYESGLEEGDSVLLKALARNVFAGNPPPDSELAILADYLRRADAALQGVEDRRMISPDPLDWPAVAIPV